MPAWAFTPEACEENFVAEGLPIDARATFVPRYFVEPGQIGTPLVCTLVPGDGSGPIIQVSEPLPESPNGAFIQYRPDGVQILRTEGSEAGLALSACGPIPDDVPPEQNPGGFWCRIDVSLGLGVTFYLEYGVDGALEWLNFEASAHADGILANSTIAPVLRETAPEDLRAGVILTESETTHLLRFAEAANVFRTVDPQSIIDLYRTQRDQPQSMTIVIETGDPQTGPFAQQVLPANVMEDMMDELSLLERLIRADRGL